MAKSLERIEARRLRREEGLGIKTIAKRVGIAKSTVSRWCRDIELTNDQIEKLVLVSRDRRLYGRLKGASVQKVRRLKFIEQCNSEGQLRFNNLTKKEFFVAGISLYWAEGYRKGRCVTFCNSDPNMMRFMINWFLTFFNLSISDFKFRVDINEAHKSRDEVVKKYWIDTLQLPPSQFYKTSFKKVVSRKVYANFNEHYGTLRFELSKPTRVIYNLMGYIYGLSLAELSGVRGSVSQPVDAMLSYKPLVK